LLGFYGFTELTDNSSRAAREIGGAQQQIPFGNDSTKKDKVEKQIPFGNDRTKKDKGEKQIPFGNDRTKKDKGEKQIPFGNDRSEKQKRRWVVGEDESVGSGSGADAGLRIQIDGLRSMHGPGRRLA
jgi:hypothetical protein